jgi:hypothetical protein
MPFEPGKSGNPAGKLKGTRNRTTIAVEARLDGEADTITRKAIELAKDGDLPALRLCLDRIAPPRKDRPVHFDFPPVSSAADAAKAAAALLEAVAVGDLTPAEASELGKLIEAYIKALEATDFAERLDKLERMTRRWSQETKLKKLGAKLSQVRSRRHCFHFDEVAEAEARGLPYVLVPRQLSREEWEKEYCIEPQEMGEEIRTAGAGEREKK